MDPVEPRRRDWALSAEEKLDARAALGLLRNSGLSLEAAVRIALASHVQPERTVAIDEAVAAFLTARRESKRRSSTLGWYGRVLGGHFATRFAARTLDTITRREIHDYLKRCKPGGRPAVFRCIRALFRFAVQQEPPWIARDPTAGMKVVPPQGDADIPVLTVEQCRKLLDTSTTQRATLTLALFAGLRPEEIAGREKEWLPWAAVNEADRKLTVKAEFSKTRRGVTLEDLPEALWAWLASVPKEQRGATVARARFREIGRWGREVLGVPVWPRDVTRHTFATYAVHAFKDPGKVALWLRHEGDQRMLYQHYLATHVTEAEARAFFALRP